MMWIYIGFIAFVITMLMIDLYVVNRKSKVIPMSIALVWTGVVVLMSLSFSAVIYVMYDENVAGLGLDSEGVPIPSAGHTALLQFLQGWVLEYSLSVDNLFVFALVFGHFRVPLAYQHRVLAWGIIGAVILRGLMIAIGAALVSRFEWVIYVFGAILIWTALKMLLTGEKELDPEKTFVVRTARQLLPVSEQYDRDRFFTRLPTGKMALTPLFLVLLVVEMTDIVFAVDSIPAIFLVTTDPFIVFTSNVFAILGLRSLYFALAGMIDKFRFLKISLAFILLFIGGKMLAEHFVHVPAGVSLAVIVSALAVGVFTSLRFPARPSGPPDPELQQAED